MRIPTLLALAMLLTAIILGVTVYSYRQEKINSNRQLFTPKNIEVVNVFENSATVAWETDNPTSGEVLFGISGLDQTSKDDRDLDNPQPHLIHFVTLKNLSPGTRYFFKVKSDNFLYPKDLNQFNTASPQIDKNKTQDPTPALIGTVLEPSLKPIDEALVFLKVQGATRLASVTSVAGNFILPIKELRTSDLKQSFDLSKKVVADLIIVRKEISSDFKISLPLKYGLLPPLILGQSFDLSTYLATASGKLQTKESSASASQNVYDLNGDGVINSLDASLVYQNFGKKPKNKNADFNKDGVVDQKDVDIFLKELNQ